MHVEHCLVEPRVRGVGEVLGQGRRANGEGRVAEGAHRGADRSVAADPSRGADRSDSSIVRAISTKPSGTG
jgi:hypothetical protein